MDIIETAIQIEGLGGRCDCEIALCEMLLNQLKRQHNELRAIKAALLEKPSGQRPATAAASEISPEMLAE